jgi:hypothetical protein
MNHRLSLVLLLATSAALISPVSAAIYRYGKRPVHSPQFRGALGDLVNDPARVEGEGSLGKSEFYYQADSAAMNKLIHRYAELDKPHAHITPGTGDYRLALQIQHDGGGHSLRIYVDDLAQLKALKLPAALPCEALHPASESLDPTLKAQQDALWQEIQTVVKRHRGE